MNLRNLSKLELDQRIKNLVSKEREVLHEILFTLKEIDQRRLYLELGYSNLFSYLTDGIGYSAGSAQRRIDAARLLIEVPEVAKQIQSGEINLNQISLAQKAARDLRKSSSKKVTALEKKEILASIAGSDFKKSQVQVAAYFDLPVLQGIRQKTQADESVRLEVTLSKELYERIQYAQALISHAVPERDLISYLNYVTDKIIQQKSRTSIRNEAKRCDGDDLETSAQGFSARQKKSMLQGQACCQYKDPVSGTQCKSTWFLQIDHIQPQWAQGSNSISNAQVLCGAHNRMKYRKEANIHSPTQN